MIATGTYVLLTHPDQLDELRRDPALLPGAIEELLRYISMLFILVRTAKHDTEIAGQQVCAGDGLIVGPALANKDPRAFPDPDRFDIHRDNRHHVAFGFGPHQCLGQPVARLELGIVLETLLRRIPTLRLDVDPRSGAVQADQPRRRRVPPGDLVSSVEVDVDRCVGGGQCVLAAPDPVRPGRPRRHGHPPAPAGAGRARRRGAGGAGLPRSRDPRRPVRAHHPGGCLVVGAGAAGFTVVDELRRAGFDGAITLVGAETHLPYDRPPLSKQVLLGAWPPERAALDHRPGAARARPRPAPGRGRPGPRRRRADGHARGRQRADRRRDRRRHRQPRRRPELGDTRTRASSRCRTLDDAHALGPGACAAAGGSPWSAPASSGSRSLPPPASVGVDEVTVVGPLEPMVAAVGATVSRRLTGPPRGARRGPRDRPPGRGRHRGRQRGDGGVRRAHRPGRRGRRCPGRPSRGGVARDERARRRRRGRRRPPRPRRAGRTRRRGGLRLAATATAGSDGSTTARAPATRPAPSPPTSSARASRSTSCRTGGPTSTTCASRPTASPATEREEHWLAGDRGRPLLRARAARRRASSGGWSAGTRPGRSARAVPLVAQPGALALGGLTAPQRHRRGPGRPPPTARPRRRAG